MMIQGIENINQKLSVNERHQLNNAKRGNEENIDIMPKEDISVLGSEAKVAKSQKALEANTELIEQRQNIEKMKERVEEMMKNQEKSFEAIKVLLYMITPGMDQLLEKK